MTAVALFSAFVLTSCKKDGTANYTTTLPNINMPDTTDTLKDDISEAVSDMGENVSDKLNDASEAVSDSMENASEANGDEAFSKELSNLKNRFVDAMDDEETAGLAFGKLSSEFIRTKVVPEMDAFRYAKYSGIEGISSASGELVDGNAVLAALVVAQSKMDEDEVPAEDRHLRITPSLYNAVNAVDTTKSKEVLASFASIAF